jgi:hypothetical protein
MYPQNYSFHTWDIVNIWTVSQYVLLRCTQQAALM